MLLPEDYVDPSTKQVHLCTGLAKSTKMGPLKFLQWAEQFPAE